jgi:hypothetical protein
MPILSSITLPPRSPVWVGGLSVGIGRTIRCSETRTDNGRDSSVRYAELRSTGVWHDLAGWSSLLLCRSCARSNRRVCRAYVLRSIWVSDPVARRWFSRIRRCESILPPAHNLGVTSPEISSSLIERGILTQCWESKKRGVKCESFGLVFLLGR